MDNAVGVAPEQSQEALLAEVERLKQEVRDAHQQTEEAVGAERERLIEFRREVGLAAAKGKAEHGWCAEIDYIMDDLGVEMPRLRARFTVSTELTFTSLCGDRDDHGEEWYAQSVQVRETSSPNGGQAYLIYLDGDHTEVRVDIDNADLTTVSVEPDDEE